MSMTLSVELFNEIISSLRSDGRCSRGHEKRTQARVGLRCGLSVVPIPSAVKRKVPAVTIHVHDLSMNGIGLVSPIWLDEESKFIANFARDGHPTVPILYKVKYCRQISDGLYSVGALFQQVLPDKKGDVLPLGKKGPTKRGQPVPKAA